MADERIIEHIRKSQATGVPWDIIKKDLLSAGWTSEQIDEAYRYVNVPRPSVPTPAPVPRAPKEAVLKKRYTSAYSGLIAVVLVVSLLILSQNAVIDILNKFAPSEYGFSESLEYKEYEKEYADRAAGLSHPLPPFYRENYQDAETYNRVYNDWYNTYYSQSSLYDQYLEKYKQRISSPSFRLVLHAGIVMPFWILTFLLFLFLKEHRRKYEALLGAYFVTSGWLLVFLFFNVAVYIYNSSTALGVYVVLGMLIIVLTAAIWGIQKYRHSMIQD